MVFYLKTFIMGIFSYRNIEQMFTWWAKIWMLCHEINIVNKMKLHKIRFVLKLIFPWWENWVKYLTLILLAIGNCCLYSCLQLCNWYETSIWGKFKAPGFCSKSWLCVQCSCLTVGTPIKSASSSALKNGPSVWSGL